MIAISKTQEVSGNFPIEFSATNSKSKALWIENTSSMYSTEKYYFLLM